MAKQPTRSKVVLLMSAAGLGLSWSGAALASRDNGNPSARFALTFGMAQRSEQACDAKSPDGWASCSPSHGELLRTIVAETTALPLPLLANVAASDDRESLRVLDIYVEATARRSADADATIEPKPGDEVPLPELPVAGRATDEPHHDRKADAVAKLWVDDRVGFAVDAATGSESIPHPTLILPSTSGSAVSSGSSTTPRRQVSEAALGVATTTATATGHLGMPDAAVGGERRIDGVQAATAEHLALVGSEPTDRVFADLAEVLGAGLDGPPPGAELQLVQAAMQELETAPRRSVADATAETGRVASASSIGVTGGDVLLQRLIDADEIVVAPSHGDKVLMSLAALRAGEGSEVAWLGAQPKKTVVVKHTEKVLETLALFKSRKPIRTALSCTAASGEAVVAGAPVDRHSAWEAPELVGNSAMVAIGQVPDILLDLMPPTTDRQDGPAQQSVAHSTMQSDLSAIAGRSQRSVMGSDLVAVSAEKLDEVRGGFVSDGGLRISFGIERAVYLNGSLVATTSLNIADLAKISGGQAQVTTSGATAGLALLQNGAGNVLAPGSITSTAAGTVIQNTLDNQKINTVTRIDAVVNSSGILRSINLQSSMRSAIVDSLRR